MEYCKHDVIADDCEQCSGRNAVQQKWFTFECSYAGRTFEVEVKHFTEGAAQDEALFKAVEHFSEPRKYITATRVR